MMVKLLLNRGANTEVRRVDVITPLQVAVWRDRRSIVSLLLATGANIEPADDCGLTPLAVITGRKNSAELLFDAGANRNAVDKDGHTPPEMVAFLRGRGAIEGPD